MTLDNIKCTVTEIKFVVTIHGKIRTSIREARIDPQTQSLVNLTSLYSKRLHSFKVRPINVVYKFTFHRRNVGS